RSVVIEWGNVARTVDKNQEPGPPPNKREGGNHHCRKAGSLSRGLSLRAADQGKERHAGSRQSKSSRQALPDHGTSLSGDVFNISACVNGAMSLQEFFVAGGTIGCSGAWPCETQRYYFFQTRTFDPHPGSYQ